MTPEFCYPKYLPLLSTLVTYNLDKQAIEQRVTKAKYVTRTLPLGDSNQGLISSFCITTLEDVRHCEMSCSRRSSSLCPVDLICFFKKPVSSHPHNLFLEMLVTLKPSLSRVCFLARCCQSRDEVSAAVQMHAGDPNGLCPGLVCAVDTSQVLPMAHVSAELVGRGPGASENPWCKDTVP